MGNDFIVNGRKRVGELHDKCAAARYRERFQSDCTHPLMLLLLSLGNVHILSLETLKLKIRQGVCYVWYLYTALIVYLLCVFSLLSAIRYYCVIYRRKPLLLITCTQMSTVSISARKMHRCAKCKCVVQSDVETILSA